MGCSRVHEEPTIVYVSSKSRGQGSSIHFQAHHGSYCLYLPPQPDMAGTPVCVLDGTIRNKAGTKSYYETNEQEWLSCFSWAVTDNKTGGHPRQRTLSRRLMFQKLTCGQSTVNSNQPKLTLNRLKSTS
jgi:hypothetical protein